MDAVNNMRRGFIYILFCCILDLVVPGYAQFSGSGSNGSEGALELTIPGEVVFDPSVFKPALNPSGDGVYHFTSIYIASGVTVKLSSKILHSPVFWLAQGPVRIDGTIDLNGTHGQSGPSLAGAGGYSGGAKGRPAYHPEGFTPNVFLVPLVGGAGGNGGETQGGGAGGGALLIASSSSIAIDGTITADGGASAGGEGGKGGAIRLVAPIINGTGLLSAKGGQPGAAGGLVRFEAFHNEFTGSLNHTPFAQGKPFGLFLPPTPQASVKVLSVGGAAVSGQDIAVSQTSPVVLVIEARFIPPGTVIQLELFPETGPAQTVNAEPLQGTFDRSRAIAMVTFPSGSSQSQIKAIWRRTPRGEQEK